MFSGLKRWGLGGALALIAAGRMCVFAADSVPLTATLHYREVQHDVASWTLTQETGSKPFTNEPALSGTVFRGTLTIGGESDNALPFIWAKSLGKLYLDLNRNRNFADDTNAVFSSSHSDYQLFARVPYAYKKGADPDKRLISISLYNPGNRLNGSVNLCSFFEGRTSLEGQEYQIGIVEGTNHKPAWLLLRPWSERDRPLRGGAQSLETVRWPERLYIHSHGYELSWSYSGSGERAQYELRLTPKETPVGDLALTGKFINRLVLDDTSAQGWLVLLDRPAASLKVPVGSYYSMSLVLGQGTAAAYLTPERTYSSQIGRVPIVKVTPGGAAMFSGGGPLTNTVTVRQQGRALTMDYSLKGAGGAPYELAPAAGRKAPRFVVYRAGKQIASGDFEFG